jgi:hypothetical protein
MSLPREAAAHTCRSLTLSLPKGARVLGWGALGLCVLVVLFLPWKVSDPLLCLRFFICQGRDS